MEEKTLGTPKPTTGAVFTPLDTFPETIDSRHVDVVFLTSLPSHVRDTCRVWYCKGLDPFRLVRMTREQLNCPLTPPPLDKSDQTKTFQQFLLVRQKTAQGFLPRNRLLSTPLPLPSPVPRSVIPLHCLVCQQLVLDPVQATVPQVKSSFLACKRCVVNIRQWRGIVHTPDPYFTPQLIELLWPLAFQERQRLNRLTPPTIEERCEDLQTFITFDPTLSEAEQAYIVDSYDMHIAQYKYMAASSNPKDRAILFQNMQSHLARKWPSCIIMRNEGKLEVFCSSSYMCLAKAHQWTLLALPSQ